MNIDLEKILKWSGTVGAVLMLFFGISLATVRQKIIEVIKTPDIVKELSKEVSRQDSIINILEYEDHITEDIREMNWELLRLMTDNRDGVELYYFADDNGDLFDVDIRETAEGKQLAFIFKMFIVYPVYTETNGRYYVMLHHSSEQNTYLYKKQE